MRLVIENRITLQRPLIDVFRTVTDFDRLGEWQQGIHAVNVIEGNPLRTGTMISIRRVFMGREVLINADVVDYQRNKRLEIQGIHGAFPFTRILDFSSAMRETTVLDTFRIRTAWIHFWYDPFLKSALNQQVRGDWQKLKQLLEAAP